MKLLRRYHFGLVQTERCNGTTDCRSPHSQLKLKYPDGKFQFLLLKSDGILVPSSFSRFQSTHKMLLINQFHPH